MANTYKIGQTPRVTGTFSVNGVNTDPTTVTLQIKKPSGVITSYTYADGDVTKSATGIFYKDLSVDKPGRWHYRFAGTGAVATADESYFDVSESEFSS